ncbi:MAG: urate hydroxylase PuuD [Verrucomicrobiota bacterium]
MSPEFVDFFNVVFRFVHVVAAIMWIGDSLLFVWMEQNLIKDAKDKQSLGHMNMLHGGGVFYLQKRVLDPTNLPKPLHEFKWQSYTTWLSGFTLLVTTFYTRSGTLLLDPSKTDMLAWQASLISLVSIILGWVLYDQVWQSPLKKYPAAAVAVLATAFLIYANWINGFFNGRFVYLQLGAMLATTMTANVFLRIIPNQKKFMAELASGKPHNLEYGRQAKLRSMMNHYVTFPVIFLMLSSHAPVTYGDDHNLIIMCIIIVGLVLIKWMMNLYQSFSEWLYVSITIFTMAVFGVVAVKALPAPPSSGPPLSAEAALGQQVFATKGCIACHQPVASSIAPSVHGLYGRERALVGGEKVVADEAYLTESILYSNAKVVEGFAPAMPGFEGVLSDEEVSQLVEYIKAISNP